MSQLKLYKADSISRQKRILTVPNLLSLLRLCLIPLFIWLYGDGQNPVITGAILILSGITDIVDGYIARRFHMVSNLGKMLDPIADKATQAAVLFCLLPDYPRMLFPLLLLIIKEMFDGITGLLIIKKTGRVLGAGWHGKMATILLYLMMIAHVMWRDIPGVISGWSVAACTGMVAVSFLLYGKRNLKILWGGLCE